MEPFKEIFHSQDYESDFEECSNSDGSDSLDVSENSDDSSNSPQLDPIELETEKRVLRFLSLKTKQFEDIYFSCIIERSDQ